MRSMKLRERQVPGACWEKERTLNTRTCGLVGDFLPWLFKLRTPRWQLAGTGEWPAVVLLSWSYLLGPMTLWEVCIVATGPGEVGLESKAEALCELEPYPWPYVQTQLHSMVRERAWQIPYSCDNDQFQVAVTSEVMQETGTLPWKSGSRFSSCIEQSMYHHAGRQSPGLSHMIPEPSPSVLCGFRDKHQPGKPGSLTEHSRSEQAVDSGPSRWTATSL